MPYANTKERFKFWVSFLPKIRVHSIIANYSSQAYIILQSDYNQRFTNFLPFWM